MSLTRIFLQRPTLIFVLIGLTLMAGVFALKNLVVQDQPNSSLPSININVAYSGASTSELETEVALPIEDQLAGLANLQVINTTISTGSVNVTCEFTINSPLAEDIANVEQALQSAQRQLPSTVTPPTIRESNPSEPNVVTIGITSNTVSEGLLGSTANENIVPAIEQLGGVAEAQVMGQTQAALEVIADPAKLAASNLTLTDLINSISSNNMRQPGGYVYQPGRETQIDVRGDIFDAASIADLPISASSGASASSSSGSASGGASTTSSAAASIVAAQSGSGTAPGIGNIAVPAAEASAPSSAISAPSNESTTSANTASPSPTPSSAAITAQAAEGETLPAAVPTIAGSYGTVHSGSGAAAAATPAAAESSQSTTSSVVSLGPDAPATVASPSTTSGSAISQSPYTEGVLPSVSSNEVGAAAGTSLAPFSGALSLWAIPTTNREVKDVAQVITGTTLQRVFVDIDGRPGIPIGVEKASDASEVTVSNTVVADLPKLQAQFPGDTFRVLHVASTYVQQQVTAVDHTLIEAVVITGLVMLFFLASWRNAVVVMVAIPTSLGVTLFVMWLAGVTLDELSLMAMTLVIGILIDDSNVVLENIQRHHENGESAPDAALNGRSEIGMASIVLTLTDVVVFVPILFAGGSVGVYLHEFALVITVSTLTSLFVAFTITPALTGLWSLHSTWKPWKPIVWFGERVDDVRERYVEQWLPWAIERTWGLLIVAGILCLLAILTVPLGILGETFIPSGDQGIIYAQVTLKPGYPLTATRNIMNQLEAATRQMIPSDQLQSEYAIAGAYSAPFGGFVQEGNVGQVVVYLDANHSTATQTFVNQMQSKFSQMVPQAQVVVEQATQEGGGTQQPIDELVATADGSDPTPYAAKVYQALKETPGATGVNDSATNESPQVEVDFDRQAMQELNVSTASAGEAVSAAFNGTQATQFVSPTYGLTYVEAMTPPQLNTNLADVTNLPIRASNGNIVRLGDIAHLHWAPTPLILTRENRMNVVHVSANLAGNANLSDTTKNFLARVKKLKLPKKVSVRPAAQGQQDEMGNALQVVLFSLTISIVLVFFLIVSLYNSYRTPFVTLFAIPLAVIGAFGALVITRQTLNLYSLIGLLVLVGIVTKNGILLVDYADISRERGMSKRDAIYESAKVRFRPIMMTTVALAFGLFPLALGLEPGGQTRASLGIVMIGGLLSSLVLTLFIVPAMYMWFAPDKMFKPVQFSEQKPAQA